MSGMPTYTAKWTLAALSAFSGSNLGAAEAAPHDLE
jgi:hypothetical protein